MNEQNVHGNSIPRTGGGSDTRKSSISLVEHDKRLMYLQELSELKKKQLRDDYKHLKKIVKDNPHLQYAVDEYDEYFVVHRKKIAALKTLLNTIVSPSDQREIKREIAALEKNLM